LSSDGEFHSFRRQAARWAEAGEIELETIAIEGGDFAGRFIARAAAGAHDLIFVSHVMFESGLVLDRLSDLAALARLEGPWVVIDGYHAFMGVETDLSEIADRIFYLAGGYKYAMAGEGCAFMHAPPGFGPRPRVTGWYAAFDHLEVAGSAVRFADDARRFLGATFDASGLYRFVAVRDMLAAEGLSSASISSHVAALRDRLLASVEDCTIGKARLLNPPGTGPQARFLAFRDPRAAEWKAKLELQDMIVDRRGEVLRIGLGLYHDEPDVDRLAGALRALE
jgi:selenocysteine lyase/cysteine desulfurase